MAEVFGNDHHEEHDVTRNNLTVDYFKVLLQVLCAVQDCDDVILNVYYTETGEFVSADQFSQILLWTLIS